MTEFAKKQGVLHGTHKFMGVTVNSALLSKYKQLYDDDEIKISNLYGQVKTLEVRVGERV